MRRRLFNIATCLSLVLLVGTAALWMRSYWRTDELALTYRGDGAEQFRSRRGTIAFIHTVFRADAKRGSVGAIKLTDMKTWIARRPVHTVLSTEKYQGLSGVSPRPWREAVAEYVREFIAPKYQGPGAAI